MIEKYTVDVTRFSPCAVCVICEPPAIKDDLHDDEARHRFSTNASALLGAAGGGHVDIIQHLLALGAPPEVGNEVWLHVVFRYLNRNRLGRLSLFVEDAVSHR